MQELHALHDTIGQITEINRAGVFAVILKAREALLKVRDAVRASFPLPHDLLYYAQWIRISETQFLQFAEDFDQWIANY